MTREPDNNTDLPEEEQGINPASEEQEPELYAGEQNAAAQSIEEEPLGEMMASNFIEYASYVIKDRAIPDINDGFKPVQRRIMHSLFEKDDGRFHKVANIIGHTMQYHPHGDASIGSALVVLANKEYFIERQGNFGNIYTGDPASAARYIECRLTDLARDVLFNKEITDYIDSYDGRNKEPVTLPAKIPSLLLLGSEGIAVGMTTRILPHNFCELLGAQIAVLQGHPFTLYPDFLTGGIMDISEYEDGLGKIKLRAKIEVVNDKTIVIREVPATTNTEQLMASIEDAVKRGKVKIGAINDYTAENVEIEIQLPRGVHAQATIKQLYAYTNCETMISANGIIIRDNTPVEITVSDILHYSTKRLLAYLKQELEIDLAKQNELFHQKTLAQIFIENRIYKQIEDKETYDFVLSAVHEGLAPFRNMLNRDITDQDVEKLLQLQIKRISQFDINKNRKDIEDILALIEQIQYNLAHLKQYAVDYVKRLLEKYGPNYPRRTQIGEMREVDVREVAFKNLKVGHDKKNGFVGTTIKNSNKNEEPLACTEFDRLVCLRNDGTFKVIPVPEKEYVGPVKYLLKADKDQVYSMLYRDRKTGNTYAKRFKIDKYIMNRDYKAIPKNCIIENLYLTYGVVIRCDLEMKRKNQDPDVTIDFDEIQLRSTGARGFKVTNRTVTGVSLVKRGTAKDPDSENNDPTNKPLTEIVDYKPEVAIPTLEEIMEKIDSQTIEDPESPVAEEKAEIAPTPEETPESIPASSSPEKTPAEDPAEKLRKWTEKSKRAATIPPNTEPEETTPKPEKVKEPKEPSDTSSKEIPEETEPEKKDAAPKNNASEPVSTDEQEEPDDTEKEKKAKEPEKELSPEPSPARSEPTSLSRRKKSNIRIDEDTPFFLE